jgi:hypothetical protein
MILSNIAWHFDDLAEDNKDSGRVMTAKDYRFMAAVLRLIDNEATNLKKKVEESFSMEVED